MKKKLTSLFAAMLAVIMLVTAIPVFAMDVDSTTVKEVEELREENVKHFEMTDGTYKAVVYSDAVHRKDADGVWQDIDNTLEAVKENGNTEYSSSDGRIKFSKNIKNGKIFELSENGYKISLSLSNKSLKDSNADVKNHKAKGTVSVFDSEEEQLEKLKNVDNLTKVRYNNIEDGIDLEYEIYSNNLKESIIVNSKKDSYVYSFELKLNKLTVALNEDGSISLKDEETGESKYTMPAPFMFDNAGELSTDVSYTLTQNGKYKYTLTVTADTEWINNEARELPVTIDPTIEVNNSYGEAYVSSTNPNTNYQKPSDGVLYLSSTQRIFLKFNLPTIPANNWITDAYLITQFYFCSSTGNMSIAAYQVPYSWNEDTITWNNSVASHQSAENSATTLSSNDITSSMTATESVPIVLPFDVTTAVQNWYSGDANNGIALKRTSGMTNAIAFKGYNSEIFIGPLLEISYEPVLNGTFYMRNVELDKYIEKGTSGLSLQPFDGQNDQKWQITYLGSGYYKIISVDSGKALAYSNGTISLQQSSSSDNQKWEISKYLNIYYHISPKSNPSYNISASGTAVQINDPQTDNHDEWRLHKYTGAPTLELQQQSNWCWAACARMAISAYFNPPVSQASIAVSTLLGSFVENPTQSQIIQYNQDGNYIKVMDILENILKTEDPCYIIGSLNETSIEEFIDEGNPIIAEVGGGSHFIVIYGYHKENSKLYLHVYDPYDYEKFGHLLDEDFDDGPYQRLNDYAILYSDLKEADSTIGWVSSIIVNAD